MRLDRVAILVAATVLAVATLAGCASGPRGTVTGHLQMVGGPASISGGTPTFPVPGTVTAVSGSASFQASASKDGSFTIVLPVGSYELTGTSPQDDSGRATCLAMSPVIVHSGSVTHADVICEIS